jgi:hypothetical protein
LIIFLTLQDFALLTDKMEVFDFNTQGSPVADNTYVDFDAGLPHAEFYEACGAVRFHQLILFLISFRLFLPGAISRIIS